MTYSILSLEEATKRFFPNTFGFFEDYRQHKNEVVKVIESDFACADLCLDVQPNDPTIAYVFMGNLTVTGNIWNENTDYAISFMALKNVKAKNIAVGGQDIYVKGHLEVEELLCGSYNHGSMTVKGNVKAQYILNDDYTFLFERRVDGIVLNDIKSGYYKINNWKESLDNYIFKKPSNIEYWDVFNPLIYDNYNNCFDFNALIKLLVKGDKLLVNNADKYNELQVNNYLLLELFKELNLKHTVNEFGFGLKQLDLSFNFHKNTPNYYLEIKLKNESFEYELKETIFTILLLKPNNLPQKLDNKNDFKNYYRAIILLKDALNHVKTYVIKRNEIINATLNLIPDLFPSELPFIYNSLEQLYNNPIGYYEDNKAFFDELNSDYLDWAFQKHAILALLKQLDIAIVINGKEYISYALNDINQWFMKRHFDIDTDWKARGLYLKRRLEYFSKDVLIVNTICEEKNIPLSILDFSIWLNDRFIVFIPVKNKDKHLFYQWFELVIND